MRVADLGTGHGLLALRAAARVGPAGTVIAVDDEPQTLEEAAGRARALGCTNLEFRIEDAGELSLETGGIDAVVAKSLLYILPDRRRPLEEAFRVLRPAGRLALFEPLLRRESIWRTAIRAGLAEALAAAGHPAFTLDIEVLRREAETAGFRGVHALTWHADVTRRYADAGEVLREWEELLPGELSLPVWWRRAGATELELQKAAESLARDSAKPGFRDLLPCVWLSAVRP